MWSHGRCAALSCGLTRARQCALRYMVAQRVWILSLFVIGTCAALPTAAAALTLTGAGAAEPSIVQTATGNCLATPSTTIRLKGPVAAGDALVLMVSGQGFDSAAPVVTGASDPVNGKWSSFVNIPSQTADGSRYLSYAVYGVASAKAAPNGVTVTVTQKAGQSAAGAVLLDIAGPVSLAHVEFPEGSPEEHAGHVRAVLP